MTCQECELALGLDQPGSFDQNVEEHLAACASCRALGRELRANTAAFESLAADALPGIQPRVLSAIRARSRARPWHRFGWAAAAAAMLAVAIGVSRSWHEEVMPPSRMFHVGPPAIDPRSPPRTRARKKPARPLMVKMLTADPDVVIYWQIESEDEEK